MEGWNLVNLINLCQGVPIGMSFAVFNLPREDVILWINKITQNAETTENSKNFMKNATQIPEIPDHQPLLDADPAPNLTQSHNLIDEIDQTSLKTLQIMALIVSIYYVGSFVGAFTAGFLNNRKGPKFTIMFNSYLLIFSTCLCFLGINILDCHMFLTAGRFFGGMFCGISSTITPIYFSQIARQGYASVYISSNFLSQRAGLLIGSILGLDAVLGTETLWKWIIIIPVVPAFFQIMLARWIPDVNDVKFQQIRQYEVENKNCQTAIEEKQLLNNTRAELKPIIVPPNPETAEPEFDNNLTVTSTLSAMSEDSTHQVQAVLIQIEPQNPKNCQHKISGLLSTGHPAKFTDIFKSQALKSSLFYSVFIAFCIVFNGITEIVQYSSAIIAEFNFNKNLMQISTLGVPICMVIFSLISGPLVNKFSRRSQLLMTTGVCCLSALLFTVLGHIDQQNYEILIQTYPWLPLPPFACVKKLVLLPMIMTVIGYVFGLGNVGFTIPSETAPAEYAGMITTCQVGIYFLGSAVSLYVFPLLKEFLGCNVFLIFVISNSLAFVYIYCRGVESSGKSVEEVMEEFEKRKCCL